MPAKTIAVPIIYVRGFAMSQPEIDETTADPFCGFNLGSTMFRATSDKAAPPRKYVFESPLVRLAKDYGYSDVYEDGLDINDAGWVGGIPLASVVIYRYYDPASSFFGSSKTPTIEQFAVGLSTLVARVQTLVCQNPDNATTPAQFRCYLVAHSMGGLVCRAFLQNPALDPLKMRTCVDKFFTYATPHNGIDVGGANVPSWLGAFDIDNFNRDRMAKYLALDAVYAKTGRVDFLPEALFPSSRIFCLVGTNRNDYSAAMGLSRTFVGNGSDGLVRIENAVVSGISVSGEKSVPTAKAFVYRSHSGYFGIVNSEESYQNLTRFLFGDVRVDIWLDIDDIALPPAVQQEVANGKDVDALYQFEVLASPRGKLWYLTRRIAEEDSVACLTQKEWVATKTKPVPLFLSTVFLSRRARVNLARNSLAYSMMLGVRVPDYEVERKLWIDEHYEGSNLFHDSVVIEMEPPDQNNAQWRVTFDWQSLNSGKAGTEVPVTFEANGTMTLSIPFASGTTPGIAGSLRFLIAPWNT